MVEARKEGMKGRRKEKERGRKEEKKGRMTGEVRGRDGSSGGEAGHCLLNTSP